MAKQKDRRRREVTPPSPFEQARDEMFQHIMRCGVIGAEAEHQTEWFNDTLAYLGDRYPELGAPEMTELRTLGERFSQPPKRPETPPVDDAQSAA